MPTGSGRWSLWSWRRVADTGAVPARVSLLVALILVASAAACGSTPTGAGSPTAPGVPATTTTGGPTTSATVGGTAGADTGSTGDATTATSIPTTTTAPPTTAAPSTAPSTTAPPTTAAPTTTPAAADVRAAQERLLALGYWLGSADGTLGGDTSHAVTAFQKMEGLKRTGRLDATTLAHLATAERPHPRATAGASRAVEVDRAHQVLLAVQDGAVRWVFDISTGKPSTPTPAGTFHVTWQVDGIRDAPLGRLYRPKYFNGGIALHGYTSVPATAASHGCVRLTYRAMDQIWAAGLAPIGTTVVVY